MDENQNTNKGEGHGSGPASIPGPAAGGVLGATGRPLFEALCGGLQAAATVLAIVFLAGGVVRRDHGMLAFGVALVAGAVVAATAPKWFLKDRFARVRFGLFGVSLILGCAVAGRGVWALVASVDERLRSESQSAAPGARDVLLVTLDQHQGALQAIDPGRLAPGFEVLDSVPSSPRREPCLASILTGLEVIEHRLLFAGDELGTLAMTAAEVFRGQGYGAYGFGGSGLPDWAMRGAQHFASEESTIDGLARALALLKTPSSRPRFVHVHLSEQGLERSVTAAMAAAPGRTVVAVVLLPDGAGGREQSRVWWGGAAGEAPDLGTMSSVCVLPSMLQLAGAGPLDGPVDGPSVFRFVGGSAGPAVMFAHGAEGAVHRLTAYLEDWKVELDLTPLGRHPFDDWHIDPFFADHIVYGNGVRAVHRQTGVAPDPGTLGELLAALAAWRIRNGSFEAR